MKIYLWKKRNEWIDAKGSLGLIFKRKRITKKATNYKQDYKRLKISFASRSEEESRRQRNMEFATNRSL